MGFKIGLRRKRPKNCYVLGRKCNNLKAVLIINGIEAPQETKSISLTTNYANFTNFLKSPTDGTEDTNTKIINYRLSELHEQEVECPARQQATSQVIVVGAHRRGAPLHQCYCVTNIRIFVIPLEGRVSAIRAYYGADIMLTFCH